jgi:hypothetical protein
MNAENPVQIDLFRVSATGTKDTRLAEHVGGSRSIVAATAGDLIGEARGPQPVWPPPAARPAPWAIGLPRRCRSQRCRWHGGQGWPGPGRSAWWSTGLRARRLPGHRGAGPASKLAAVMNAWRSVCGPTFLLIPARQVTLHTIRAAPWRSRRRPSAARKRGPPVRSPMARSMARAVRGASGMVTTLPPLRVITRVRWPRSRPRCSMSAPVASETRSPLRASSEIRACSAAGPIPAATRSAPPRCGPGL